MDKKLSQDELIAIIRDVLEVKDPLDENTDMTKYIKDSIDLGEVLAVIKEKYGIVLQTTQFKDAYKLAEVLTVVNQGSNG